MTLKRGSQTERFAFSIARETKEEEGIEPLLPYVAKEARHDEVLEQKITQGRWRDEGRISKPKEGGQGCIEGVNVRIVRRRQSWAKG